MKRAFISVFCAFLCACMGAQICKDGYTYREATELTVCGKVFSDTPNPYHRIDTTRFHGFTAEEVRLLQESSGVSIAFRTDAHSIRVWPRYGKTYFGGGTTGFAGRGFDLYIRRDGKWLWAASGLQNDNHLDDPVKLIQDMADGEKECLLYLPLRSELLEVRIGVEDGATLEPLESPFRYRVAVFGSSFTQGASTSKAGMCYPSILSRESGIEFLNLGVSGRCRLQDYFAVALSAAENVDAFLFDTFSNPTPKEIRERLFPFIEAVQAAHPGVPLVFQRTIYRERRNFNTAADKYEAERMALSDSLMRVACKRYPDVYYITKNTATSPDHYTSVDGTHPGDYGYTLWARSLWRPLRKILKKYGIK